MSKILNPLELEQKLKNNINYNYRQFIILNSHNIELYVKKYIEKQLGKKNCFINEKTHKPNSIKHIPYDLILTYRNKDYSIEIKSGKRFISLKNGHYRNGYFKIGNKLIYNKPDIVVFCSYYKKYRFVYFCNGYFVKNFLLTHYKTKKIYRTITINQMFEFFKPKEKIKDIIKEMK